jgi:GR25 family glycosyltransferase involved in LPS biosynthesis
MVLSYRFNDAMVQKLVAVNGSLLTNEEKNVLTTNRARGEILFGRKSHEGLPSWGAVGCTLSHKKAWEECVALNTKMLVLEDDAEFVGSKDLWITKFNSYMDDVAEWDICMLQGIKGTPLNKSLNVTKNPWPEGKHFFGCHSYIITPKGAQILLDNVLPINEQTDFYIQICAHFNGLRIAGPTKNIAKQGKHKSTIQNKSPDLEKIELAIVFFILGILISFAIYKFFLQK